MADPRAFIPLAKPPSSSTAASSSAPLKLTFRLGGNGASSAQSSAPVSAPISAPASEDNMDLDGSAEPYESISEAGSSVAGHYSASHMGATVGAALGALDARVGKLNVPGPRRVMAPSATPSSASGSAAKELDADGKPKVKRKRAVKRAPGQIGPGKSWRKGLKGNLAGVGLPEHPSSTPSAFFPTPSAFSIGPAPRIQATFLPPLALELRTPRPRKWTKVVKQLTSVSGMTLHFRSWQGQPDPITLPVPPSHLPAYPSSPLPNAYQSSNQSSPALPSGSNQTHYYPAPNRDPKAAAMAAAAAFRKFEMVKEVPNGVKMEEKVMGTMDV